MRGPLAFLLAVAFLPSVMPNAHANDAAYVVSYIEVAPASAASAAATLKEFIARSHTDKGSLRFEALQRIDRPHHFAVLEVWQDAAAQAAHAGAAHVKQLRDRLQAMQAAPYDERPHTGLAAGAITAGASFPRGAVYAVTHVDFIPPKKDEGIAALKSLVAPSRAEAGNLRFDVLQQASRLNHLTVVEVWQDLAALDAHAVATHTKQFREQLLPMSGSLFDERLYRSLD